MAAASVTVVVRVVSVTSIAAGVVVKVAAAKVRLVRSSGDRDFKLSRDLSVAKRNDRDFGGRDFN